MLDTFWRMHNQSKYINRVMFEPRHLVQWRRSHADGTNLFCLHCVHDYETVKLIVNTVPCSVSLENKIAHDH